MENNTHLNGCNCHSCPPCSFCVDTFICACCGNREYSAEAVEENLGFICLRCQENKTLAMTYETGAQGKDYFNIYVAGRPSLRVTNINFKAGPLPTNPRFNYNALPFDLGKLH